MRECNFEKGMGMAGYMPQDVFEVGAASIAKMHLDLGHPVDELAADIWKDCATANIDDGVENDLKNAATEAIQMLETLEAPSPAEFLHHFQYFTIHYDEEGKPRKKKIFGGTWFNKAAQNKNRRQDFIKRLKLYYIGAIAGSMPLAPDGWSLGGRKYVSP